MHEDIAVTIQALYTCPADASLSAQSDMIHQDLIRLMDDDTYRMVAIKAVSIQKVQAVTANGCDDSARPDTARMADRIADVLEEAYPDAGSIMHVLNYALCDLRHLADREEIVFKDCDRAGHRIYQAERHGASHEA